MIRRKKAVDIIDLKKKEKNEVSLGNLFRGSIEWRLSFSPIYLALRRINKKFEYSSIVNELFRVRNNSLKQKRKKKKKKKTIDKLTSRLDTLANVFVFVKQGFNYSRDSSTSGGRFLLDGDIDRR